MTHARLVILAGLGSVLLIAGAYLFQAMGYLPCQLCYWQRWPHFAAMAIAALVLLTGLRGLAWLGALAAASTAGVGIYHTGVERKWWPGPQSCTGDGSLDSLSGTDLLSTEGPRLILCDQVSWELFSVSMASWNAIFSLLLVIIWVAAARARQ